MSTTDMTSERIVVVHGPADEALTEILIQSGLELVVGNCKISIWGPRATHARTVGEAEAS